LAPDTAHAPFVYGVASGSPRVDGVTLWTYVATTAPQTLAWQVAADSTFADVVAQGQTTAGPETGYTVKIDVEGLRAGKRYFYRFLANDGKTSVVGKTRTTGASNRVRLGIVSCSSVYSGYFNAYRNLARRQDVDAVVHLGDYIYDFVDEDEKVFVPDPFPTVPQNLTEWRKRHAYYLLDPDLRAARQNLPWLMIWDNHDLDRGAPDDGARAFWEWNPIRMPDTTDLRRIYQTYAFGDPADVVLLDALLHRPPKTDGQPDTLSILGETQFAWFKEQLAASTARWRIIGNQKLISSFSVPFLPGFENDNSPWAEYPGGRERFGRALLNKADNVLIGGDAHIGFANDFADPTYRPDDRTGAYAPEFLPNSVSRGNVDEQVGNAFGSPSQLNRLGRDLVYPNNPHIRFIDLVSHGYGILDVSRDSVVAEFWFCPILEKTDQESLAVKIAVRAGQRHWNAPTTPTARTLSEYAPYVRLHPNPAQDFIRITWGGRETPSVQYRIVRAGDAKIMARGALPAGPRSHLFPLSDYPSGLYILYLHTDEHYWAEKFCKR
jgi:alkaline phosphatase D